MTGLPLADKTTEPTFPAAVAPQTAAVFAANQQQQMETTSKVVGRPFRKGQSGNPKGRPKGSRNRLTDSVLKKIAQDFAENGADVLERVRTEEPAVYLKFIISLLPRELVLQFEQHRPSEVSQLSSEEIVELAECEQTQKMAEHAYRNVPPAASR